jgi:tetratricopeptide (TPR) repeat protein
MNTATAENTKMPDSSSTARGSQATCFVVMGFGKKTDFETGRVLDLDASYRNLIKPAVEAAGLKCVRADEIRHSGLIDVPMYEQLFSADVVVADLSTSNRNAIYELGVRHALRPFTTVIIAEDGIMKSPFFDLSHIVIRTYRHLGEDIGVSEMRRFTAELTAAIKEIQSREAKLRWDSPVYEFIQRLVPPSVAAEAAKVPASLLPGGSPPPGADAKGNSQPTSTPSGTTIEPGTAYSEMMRRVDEAQKKGKKDGWLKAKILLEEVRELRKAEIAKLPEERQTAKTEDPYLLQRLALATYKSEYPDAEAALREARDLLALLEPQTSNDTETLGMWGSVHKQLWQLTKDRSHLDEAVRAYERGFYIRNDYYNGINFAFLLNVRAANTGDPAEAIADFVQARRVRKEVIEICDSWLAANLEPSAGDADEVALQKYRESRYWVLATLAEAEIGLGEKERAQQRLNEAYAVASANWMKEATQKQLDALRPLLAASPLEHLKQGPG